MKKILILGLSLILLCSSLFSCVSAKKTPDNTTSGDGTTKSTPVTTNPNDDHGYELPAIEDSDYTFIAGAGSRSDFRSELGFEMTEDGGDIYSKAIISRNKYIEDEFNVTLEAQYYDNINFVAAQIQAGVCKIDLLSATPVDSSGLMLRGYFLDWSKENLPYVNHDAPWYLKAMNDELSINGQSYYYAGDFNLSTIRFTYCYFFNQKLLFQELNLSPNDMYDLVNEKEWTLEKLNQMVRDVYSDIGTTMGEKDDDDIFGYVSNWYSAAVTYNYAFDNRVMIKNEAGYPELNEMFYNKGVEITEKVHDLFFGNPGAYVGDWGERERIWINGHSLFIASVIGDATSYQDCNFEFGVIPYPMFDKMQKEYFTMVDGAHALSAIPYNVPKERLSNNSIVIEALNAETRHTVRDVYFEQILKLRSFQEEAAGKVLDLLLNSRTFDFGYLYSNTSTGFPFLIQLVMKSEYSEEKKTFTTLYEENKTSNVNTYNNIIQQLVNLTNS